MVAFSKTVVKATAVNCAPCRVRAVRLNTLLCQVSLPFPPNRTDPFPSIRLSSFPLDPLLAKSGEEYVRVSHCVLLLHPSPSENLLAFALRSAFPTSDYYANSVVWSDFQALLP